MFRLQTKIDVRSAEFKKNRDVNLALAAEYRERLAKVREMGPADFAADVPYALGLVEVAPGVRLMAQIVDVPAEEIKTGMPVTLEFRKLYEEGKAGIICYGHKAVPA